ncbi:MAG: acyltransferase [Sphingomicrobium sp.]
MISKVLPTATYRAELDGLRAVAIGAVMLFHAYPGLVHGGWVGVDIFFVLSGYLITSLLVNELDVSGTIRLGRFYLRRCYRLVPALALLLFVVAYVQFVVRGGSWAISGWPILMAATYLMNWNRAFGWGSVSPVGHTWSLAIEEQFYLLWPLLLRAMPAGKRLKLSLGLLAAAFVWRVAMVSAGASADRVLNGFDTHADSLLVGCVLAQVGVHGRFSAPLARLWPVPAVLLPMFALLLPYDSAFAATSGILLVALSTAWLIVAAAQRGTLQAMLSMPLLVGLGQISYGVYLWHDPLLIYFKQYLPPALAILPAIAAIPLAIASFRLVERPALRWRDRRQSVGGGLPFGIFGFFARERDA